MTIIVVGVDVGVTGALSWLDSDTRKLVHIYDMPTLVVTSDGKPRQEVDPAILAQYFHHLRPHLVVIEEPKARPVMGRSRQTGERIPITRGGTSMLKLGDSFGAVRGVCGALVIPIRRTAPGVWKRQMGLTADKDEARRFAIEQFPESAARFQRKKDDGRAESALLALWGVRWMR